MKSISIILLISLFISGLIACNSSDTSQIGDSSYIKIASDPLFIDYMKTLEKDMFNIASNTYDIIKMGDVIEKNHIMDFCNVDPAILSAVKGGDLYAEISCQLNSKRKKLFEKYPFYKNVTLEEVKKINSIYRETHTNYIDTISRILIK